MTKEKEAPALQPMLSLATAVQRAYSAATKREDPSEDTLNSVPRVIAMHVTVFVCEPGKSCCDPDLLMHDEIFQGTSREGASP